MVHVTPVIYFPFGVLVWDGYPPFLGVRPLVGIPEGDILFYGFGTCWEDIFLEGWCIIAVYGPERVYCSSICLCMRNISSCWDRLMSPTLSDFTFGFAVRRKWAGPFPSTWYWWHAPSFFFSFLCFFSLCSFFCLFLSLFFLHSHQEIYVRENIPGSNNLVYQGVSELNWLNLLSQSSLLRSLHPLVHAFEWSWHIASVDRLTQRPRAKLPNETT